MNTSAGQAVERLQLALARQGPAAASVLAQALGVSIPTVHRLLAQLGDGRLLSAGRARRTRYALRRPLRGLLGELPVYEIDGTGQARLLAPLALLQPQGYRLDLAGTRWPVPDEARDGWWPGLPYPLYDMRPQGYMGRLFARHEHRALGVAPDPQAWSDDDIVHVLAQRGSDASGNLIVGETAYLLWQESRLALSEPIPSHETAPAYAVLAERAIAAGVPGSSAAGEFPKFAARREPPPGQPCDTTHVLVKFSGADDSPAVRRWADLLVCEHLALEALGTLPQRAVARSRVLSASGRTFLEVERFDRHGEFGRSALCTLETVDGALLGSPPADWDRVAQRLHAAGLLGADDLRQIQWQWWFGRLIANTDMHSGNLSFRPEGGMLQLAPAYDMLPMLHAPLPGGEVTLRAFTPALPLPPQRDLWHAACGAALRFWAMAAVDERISPAFRDHCALHARQLEAAARHA